MQIISLFDFMELKSYEMGGPVDLRFVFSRVGIKGYCSAYWTDGTYSLDLDFCPLDSQRMTGSLCQYMLKTLSKLHGNNVSILVKNHITNLSRFINLVVKIGYEKMNNQLKIRLLICMHEGVTLWKNLMQNLVEYEISEVKIQIKEIARYIIMLEMILYDCFN